MRWYESRTIGSLAESHYVVFPDPDTRHAADAYYVPPGHTPLMYDGNEIVEIQPDR
jgi:hypothetical protein